ncbi:uncharacterized protein LOC122052002 [Zingiber officinale]|uniref:uncharacterized protein LOC122052001 n=1 Tax=Zingiber officinale TaxID=94328 RepID=UPI001C4C714F|nr:uncharacterized protein LOC122052001 [Zingiber officinale]XP_042469305.1 uncharacterized protein LOC122052002 [Zingiber officinale]
MEEPKLPPPAASGTPSVVSPAGDVTMPRGKKRKLDVDEFRNSDYYKLRLMVKDLRPLFLEVLRTPNFQTSKAACEIQNQMKTMLVLIKKLRGDVDSSENCKSPSQAESSFKVKDEESLEMHVEDEKIEQHETGHDPTIPVKASQPEKNTTVSDSNQEKTHAEWIAEVREKVKQFDVASLGSYVIGGSKIGWNFLVYLGSEPVYYGVTKESFLARRSAK